MSFRARQPGCPCCEDLIECRGCPDGAPPYLLAEIAGFTGTGCEHMNGSHVLAYTGETGSGLNTYLCNYYGQIPCTTNGDTIPCYPCSLFPDSNLSVRGILEYNATTGDWRIAIIEESGTMIRFRLTGNGNWDCAGLDDVSVPKEYDTGCCDQSNIACNVTALT